MVDPSTGAEATRAFLAARFDSAPPRAVLFDLDGTLADTEPAWMAAKAAVAARYGIVWTAQDSRDSIGQPTPMYCAEFVRRGVPATVDEVAHQITSAVTAEIERCVSWKPGALEALQHAVDAGLDTALVTMAYRPVAEAIVRATNLPVFATIVAGDDVENSKPHPEPYLRALHALGLDARDAIAIEDTATGAASALAAGVTTVLVPTAAIPPAQPGLFVLDSLTQLPVFHRG